MIVCMLCEAPITEFNNSAEHLFPNAIGGHRKIPNVLCRDCNSTAGDSWDNVLARQLLPLSLLLGIRRDRGDTPPLKVTTTAGENVTITTSGKLAWTRPIVDKDPVAGGGTQYQIKARTVEEAKQIVSDLKRKHPEIDVEAIMSSMQSQETYLAGLVHHNLGFGGEAAGRSVVKSCLVMAAASGIDWRTCHAALAYLRDKDAEPCFGYFQERDLVLPRTAGLPVHCVAVKANPDTGLVLAYIEYFGIYRIVACLGDAYAGEPYLQVYAIDPRSNTLVDVAVDLDFDRGKIEDIYAYKCMSPDNQRGAFDSVIGPVFQQQNDIEQQRVTSKAVEIAFANCGAKPGQMLSEEHIRSIARSMAETIMPWLSHRLRPVRPPGAIEPGTTGT